MADFWYFYYLFLHFLHHEILLIICHVNSLLAEQEEWKAWAIPVIWIQRQDH